MVAVRAQTIWGANLIPLGAACGGGDDPRRKPARSRVPANCLWWNEGSDDGMPTTPRRRALGDAASCWAAAVRLGNFREDFNKKPATDFSVRALRFLR